MIKRLIDFYGALFLLFLLMPVFAAISLLITTFTPGPVIFRQERVGQGGKTFTIYKFRTMWDNHEPVEVSGLLDKVRGDDCRVTPFGRFLRRFSLDELPQLVNVLDGAMSLVGPRPQVPAEVALYSPEAHGRLIAKPGMTGAWQVSGRSNLTWEQCLAIDLDYVRNQSLWLDTVILFKTFKAVAFGHGAY